MTVITTPGNPTNLLCGLWKCRETRKHQRIRDYIVAQTEIKDNPSAAFIFILLGLRQDSSHECRSKIDFPERLNVLKKGGTNEQEATQRFKRNDVKAEDQKSVI